MKDKIRIASGQGFWGDLIDAPYHQVTKGEIDYLVMDYLAEVTMSILQKQKNKNPKLGYASDIPDLMKRILPICLDKKIKVITNGGGVNPVACAEAILETASQLKINNLRVAVVLGDNIIDSLDEIISKGCELKNMETGDQESARLHLPFPKHLRPAISAQHNRGGPDRDQCKHQQAVRQ